jgi:hypothetical protein
LKIKEGKELLDFLRRNNLEFRYDKYNNNLYDIHITNLTLVNVSFADFMSLVEMNFLINNPDYKFLHILKSSLDIEITAGDLHSHDKITLKKARITWDRSSGLEILWRGKK